MRARGRRARKGAWVMAYDEDLADHIREAIHDQDGRDRDADVRRLAVLVDGNMAVCDTRSHALSGSR